MIRALASLRQPDGSYPDVGMNDRTVIDAKTVTLARRQALKWAGQTPVRVEYHNGTLLKPAFRTEHW